MRRVSEVCRRFLFRGKPQRRMHAFTLLELVVVIAIITIIAGIVVRVLPDLMRDTNNARLVGNLRELDNLIQTFQASPTGQGVYPDQWDSLLVGGSTLYTKLPSATDSSTSATTYCGGYITTGTLTTAQLSLLKVGGITTLRDMSSSPKWATYLAGSTSRTLAAGGTIAVLAKDSSGSYATLAGTVFNLNDNHTYMVVGIGHYCTLIGNPDGNNPGLVKDAPVIVHNQGCEDPVTTYCAPVAIFDLSGTDVDTKKGDFAKFVGCAALSSSGFITGSFVTNKIQ